jgi:hypothetical protein
MSNTRNTQSSQRAGIGEALAALTRRSATPAPEALTSNLPSQQSSTSDFVLSSLVPMGPPSIDANTDPDDQNLSDHGSQAYSEHDPDQNVQTEQLDQSLAKALELLADRIASIPEAQKSNNAIKP